MTVVKEFAVAALFQEARGKPLAVAARVLPKQLAAKRLHVIAAVSCDDLVTCVSTAPKTAEQVCSNAVSGDRVFLGPRKPPEEKPSWVQHGKGVDSNTYLEEVQAAAEAKGKLTHRQGGGNSLGARSATRLATPWHGNALGCHLSGQRGTSESGLKSGSFWKWAVYIGGGGRPVELQGMAGQREAAFSSAACIGDCCQQTW